MHMCSVKYASRYLFLSTLTDFHYYKKTVQFAVQWYNIHSMCKLQIPNFKSGTIISALKFRKYWPLVLKMKSLKNHRYFEILSTTNSRNLHYSNVPMEITYLFLGHTPIIFLDMFCMGATHRDIF